MRICILIFCLLFSACRPTPAETAAGGPGKANGEPIQALYFIFKSKGACLPHQMTTALGSLRVHATPYFDFNKSPAAPGRIGELRLPAEISKGGNDSVRFADGGRLISFDPVHRTLLVTVTRGRLIRLSIDGGFKEIAAAEIDPLTELSILWWETNETDLAKVAAEMERAVRSSWTEAEQANRLLIGISKSSDGLTRLEQDPETLLHVVQAGTSQKSQYNRAYLGGYFVSETVTNDPLERVKQVRWAPASATAASQCGAASDLEPARRTVNIGTNERPLFVDLIGSPDTAKRILVFFGGGPSGWTRRQNIQYFTPLLADPEVALAQIAYSGSSGSGLATYNRLRTETPARAIQQDVAAVANWLSDKHAPMTVVGASFGAAFATPLAAMMGAENHRCVRLALIVPLLKHTEASYTSMGDRAQYQRAFERSMLGPDLAKSWALYNEISKKSLDTATRPATTFVIAEHDELIRKEDVLPFVRPDRDKVIQVAGAHSTASGDPTITAALRSAFASCVP